MDIGEALFDFYGGEIPGYIKKAGKTYLVINMEGGSEHKITIRDVARYYVTQANNIVSGCRTLADILGDWRPIDGLAKECLEWFKYVNMDVLKRESRKAGLEPRF